MRGEIYPVREPGSVASKARPCVIVQTDLALPAPHFITVYPITSILRGLPLIRVVIAPDAINGLKWVSEIEADLVDTVRVCNLGPRIGQVAPAIMLQLDAALRRWLAL